MSPLTGNTPVRTVPFDRKHANENRPLWLFLVLFLLCGLTVQAAEEPEDRLRQAREIALRFQLPKGDAADALYTDDTRERISLISGEEIVISAEEEIAGLYVIWGSPAPAWTLSTAGEETACGTNGFIHEYVPLATPQKSCTMTLHAEADLCAIKAYGEGELPEEVQVWEPQLDRADMLVLATHADDDILFMGGVLATYAGERKLDVQVAFMVSHWTEFDRVREHEKLDALWHIGVRHYPVTGPFLPNRTDLYEDVRAFAAETVRRFEPQILVTHDLNGEYGHVRHSALAHAAAEAAEHSMDATYEPESAALYGTWDVPKTYLHLYPENVVFMDLRTPLSAFDGKTALEVATEAFTFHASQQIYTDLFVTDDPTVRLGDKYNCAHFGLFRSTVGADTGADLTEHIVPYAEAERMEEEAARAAEEEAARLAQEEERARQEERAQTGQCLLEEARIREEELLAQEERPRQEQEAESRAVTVLVAVMTAGCIGLVFAVWKKRRRG